MLSSNKISFTELSYEENQLQTAWGGVFYHPVFLKSAADVLGLSNSACYINVEDITVGAVNLLYQDRNYIKAATIPHLFQYFGVLFFSLPYEKSLMKDALSKIEAESDYLYLCFTPEFHSIDMLSKQWNLVKSVTLCMSEADLQNWGDGFKYSVVKQIKKANREKIVVKTTNAIPVELWEKSYSRSDANTPIPSDKLKLWCEDLVKGSLLKIYVAEIDSNPIAFRGELIYGNFAYDWIAGSDPEFNITGVNQLLMSEIGDDLRNSGIKMWDLVDARIESIGRFKRSFGAKEYFHWQAFRDIGVKGKLFNFLRKYKNS